MGIYKKTLYILTLVALVPYINANGPTAPTINHLACTVDGQMTLTVSASVQKVSVICDNVPTLSPGSTVSPGIAALKNHTVTIKNCKKNTAATLLLFTSDATTPNPATVSTLESTQVSLTCYSIIKKTIETAWLQINGPTIVPKTVTETVNPITMKLLNSVDPYAETTEVTIGGTYIIVISGDEPYFKKVTSCKASDTEEDGDAEIDVFKNAISTTNVMSNINQTTKDAISHMLPQPHDAALALTGFRLVGSTTVYLKCSVDVCIHKSCGSARKRKGHTGHPKVRYATMKFEVKDRILRTSTNGSKGIHSSARSLVILFIVTILRYNTF